MFVAERFLKNDGIVCLATYLNPDDKLISPDEDNTSNANKHVEIEAENAENPVEIDDKQAQLRRCARQRVRAEFVGRVLALIAR